MLMHIMLWTLHVCSLQEGLEEVVRMVNFFQVYTLNHQLMEQLKGNTASMEIYGQVIEVNWRHVLNCSISKSSLVFESLRGLNRRPSGAHRIVPSDCCEQSPRHAGEETLHSSYFSRSFRDSHRIGHVDWADSKPELYSFLQYGVARSSK